MRDPYSVLGVARNAGDGEVKKAYHRLAKELHPDLNPDDDVVAERFKEVSAAYSLLGDPATRKRFDKGEIGADGQEKARYSYEYAGGNGSPGGGFGRGPNGGAGFNANDILVNFSPTCAVGMPAKLGSKRARTVPIKLRWNFWMRPRVQPGASPCRMAECSMSAFQRG